MTVEKDDLQKEDSESINFENSDKGEKNADESDSHGDEEAKTMIDIEN